MLDTAIIPKEDGESSSMSVIWARPDATSPMGCIVSNMFRSPPLESWFGRVKFAQNLLGGRNPTGCKGTRQSSAVLRRLRVLPFHGNEQAIGRYCGANRRVDILQTYWAYYPHRGIHRHSLPALPDVRTSVRGCLTSNCALLQCCVNEVGDNCFHRHSAVGSSLLAPR